MNKQTKLSFFILHSVLLLCLSTSQSVFAMKRKRQESPSDKEQPKRKKRRVVTKYSLPTNFPLPAEVLDRINRFALDAENPLSSLNPLSLVNKQFNAGTQITHDCYLVRNAEKNNRSEQLKEKYKHSSQPVLHLLFKALDIVYDDISRISLSDDPNNTIKNLIPAHCIALEVHPKAANLLANEIVKKIEKSLDPLEPINQDDLTVPEICYLIMFSAKYGNTHVIKWLKNKYPKHFFIKDNLYDYRRDFHWFGWPKIICDAVICALENKQLKFAAYCFENFLSLDSYTDYRLATEYNDQEEFLSIKQRHNHLQSFENTLATDFISEDDDNLNVIKYLFGKTIPISYGGSVLLRGLLIALKQGDLRFAKEINIMDNAECIEEWFSCKDLYSVLLNRVQAKDIPSITWILNQFKHYMHKCDCNYKRETSLCNISILFAIIEYACQNNLGTNVLDALINNEHTDKEKLLHLAITHQKQNAHLEIRKRGKK